MTTTIEEPPLQSWRLAHPDATPSFKFSGTLPVDNLTERHRPRTLAELVGQGQAVYRLQTFLDAPYPVPFLFEGPTGVGKTSAARALANDLGVDPDWGFEDIKSARADRDAVERALRMLRHVAPGSGWKLVLVDEADLMTPKASHLWLSALEDLPPKSVIVFTTNAPERFPDRFLDRCERIRFEGDGRTLEQDAQSLVDAIWAEETGSMDGVPSVGDLPDLVDSRGLISFRRAVSALGPLLRAKRRPMPAGPPTVAFAPRTASDAPRSRVAIAAAKPARTPRKRPTATLRPPVAKPPAFRPDSRELVKLRMALNDLLAEDDRLIDLCADAVDAADRARAEWKTAPRFLRAELKARLDAEDEEVTRLGGLAIDLDARIDVTRDAIKRADRAGRMAK